jgi:hypothetical protein
MSALLSDFDAGRWLTATETLALVEARLGNKAAAEIIAWALAGRFKARAELRTIMRGKSLAPMNAVDEAVPAWCWALCADPVNADWATGRFSGAGAVGGDHVHLQLLGVQFHAANVEAAAPPPSKRRPLTSEEGKLRPDIAIYAGGITWVDADTGLGLLPISPTEGSAADLPVQGPQWTEEEMAQAIRQCGITSRDSAWRTYFKDLPHGWSNISFRALWSKARDTSNRAGRPRKDRPQKSAQ